MNDGYKTESFFVAAAVMYAYGPESLTAVRQDLGIISVELDAPSIDCELMATEFKDGQLAISDLKTWTRHYLDLTRIMRNLKRSGDSVWHSQSWLQGRGA